MRPLPSPAAHRAAGFTLIEVSIALILLLAGLMIAADLLMETARLFAETSGEAIDTPVPLALARIRGDMEGASAVIPVLTEEGKLDKVRIRMVGQEIDYEKLDDSLYRLVLPDSGISSEPEALWHGVTDWTCTQGGTASPVWFSVTYQRRSTPHSPLPVLPLYRGKLEEPRIEKFYVLPRGNGW